MRLRTFLATSALTVTLISPALAAKPPKDGSADARVKTFTYHADDVFTLTGHYGFTTAIEFGNGEVIETIGIGDSSAWQITKAGRGNLVFVKPLEEDAYTNMTIVTNQRIYTFELSSDQASSHRSKDLAFRVKFIYPGVIDAALAGPDDTYIYKSDISYGAGGFEGGSFSTVPPHEWNFNYSFSGEIDLRPIRAFDDGRFTYFQFADHGKTPAIFTVDDQGNEEIVNFNTRGKYVVVERLARQFTFRDGQQAICIFNESFPEISQASMMEGPRPRKSADGTFQWSFLDITPPAQKHFNN